MLALPDALSRLLSEYQIDLFGRQAQVILTVLSDKLDGSGVGHYFW